MKKLIALALLTFALSPNIKADVVYVTARSHGAGCGVSTSTCPGKNTDLNGLGGNVYSEISVTLGDVGAKSTQADAPERSGQRGYLSSTTLTSTSSGIDISPTLGADGGVYLIEYTQSSSAGNVSPDCVFSTTATGGSLSFTNTTAFQSAGTSTWKTMGYITNNAGVTTPTVSFRYQSGTINSGSGKRWVIDTFRFTLYNPCQLVTAPTVLGPVAAGQTTISVTNITAGATQITIYEDTGSGMTAIGQKTSGIVSGTNTNSVTVTPLTKDGQVAVTQTVGGQESCVPSVGLLVGGGANPRIRMVLSIRETTNTTTGPVGADGRTFTTNSFGRIHFLGASTVVGGVPQEGKVINPSNDWQTVTFQRGSDPANPVDPTVLWNASTGGGSVGTQNDLQGNWGTIESIAFVSDDLTDNGPFEIYLDNIVNGTTNVETFENGLAGQSGYTFWQPSFSGTTSGNMLSAPDETIVVNSAADSGTKALRTKFQFSDHAANRWIRFTTSNTTSGHPNPLVYLNDPITLRILLIPVGSTPVAPLPPTISAGASGTNVVLNWQGAHRLLESTVITGPYVTNAATLAPVTTNSAAAAQKFFKLKD